MGIKFHCPNGHKLHVKSFLAGKKGVCPECGIKIVIPEQSEPKRARKQSHEEGAAPLTNPGANPSAVATATFANMSANSVPMAAGFAPTASTAASVGKPTPVSAFPQFSPTGSSMPATAAPMAGGPAVASTVPATTHVHPSAPGMPMPMGVGVAMSAMPAVPTAPYSPVGTGQPMMPQQMASPMAVAAIASPTHAPDPIDENPGANWYVRPPSGGQYGPARGDVMRKWIGEGRVSADSLVWREGWTDWLSAVAIFPTLKGAAADESPTAAPFLASGPISSSTSTKKRTTSRSRGPSPGTAVAIVVFLALMAVGLLIALFYVLNQTQHSSRKKAAPQHAAARCVEPLRVF